MTKLASILLSAAALSGAAQFTIDPGQYHYGAGYANLTSQVTVTLGGSGSGSLFIYFTMDGRLNISLPPGVSGSCSGGPCYAFTTSSDASSAFHAGANAFPSDAIPGMVFSVDAVFSTSSAGSNPMTSLDDATLFRYGGPNTYELGTKVYTDVDGYIVGVRFNKPPTDGSTSHKVSLWDIAGNLIATANTSSETTAGWQTATFTTPVAVHANTTYVASYFTMGPFWFNSNALQNRNYGSGLIHSQGNYVASNGGCNVWDAWPLDADGRPAAGIVGCADISNGSINNLRTADSVTSAFASEGCQCMVGGIGPGPYKFENNYSSAVGLPWHHDDSGDDDFTRGDYFYRRNTFFTPFTRMYGHPLSDGMRYSHRQPLEWKSGQRIHLIGNIFDQGWVENNPVGATITMTSVAGQGITDVNIESNTFRHLPGIMNAPSIVDGGRAFTKPTTRFRFANNLIYDLNINMNYWVQAGFASPPGWLFQGPNGSEDVVIDHNSVIGNTGRLPSIIHMYETKLEGLQVSNNVFYFSNGDSGITLESGIPFSSCSGVGKAMADCFFTGGYRWDHNLFLGPTDQATLQSWWPSLANYIPSNPSNLQAVGWFSVDQNNYRFRSRYCSGCGSAASDRTDVGADIDKLEADQGAVKLIGVPTSTLTSTSATISFVAPDAQACPVDYSTSDSSLIQSFTRVSDTGANRTRGVLLSGLNPKTLYYYRVNCAVEQPTGQFRTR